MNQVTIVRKMLKVDELNILELRETQGTFADFTCWFTGFKMQLTEQQAEQFLLDFYELAKEFNLQLSDELTKRLLVINKGKNE